MPLPDHAEPSWRHLSEVRVEKLFNGSLQHGRFSLRKLYELLQVELGTQLERLTRRLALALGETQANHLLFAAFRASFMIELTVLPEAETTRFGTRWGDRLDPVDPRWTSLPECLEIFTQLVDKLSQDAGVPAMARSLRLVGRTPLLPYEAPICYVDRTVPRLHQQGNVTWFLGSELLKTLRLREILLSPDNPTQALWRRVYDKIRMKSYLTDRAQTGEFKTNREKRWEAHPDDPQFAGRLDCMGVERTLIEQVCSFEGFPEDLRAALVSKTLIRPLPTHRCPVTLEPLLFSAFVSEVEKPRQGESLFQVGHKHPLSHASPFGHVASNVAWFSADGNRIQGKLTLGETHALLQRIEANRCMRGHEAREAKEAPQAQRRRGQEARRS